MVLFTQENQYQINNSNVLHVFYSFIIDFIKFSQFNTR